MWVPLHARLWHALQSRRAYAFKGEGKGVGFPARPLPASRLAKQVCTDILRLYEGGAFDSAKAVDPSSEDPLAFFSDVTARLPLAARRDVIRLALEPDVLDWVVRYFGFAPHLHRVSLGLNSPVSTLAEEGSKLWHRDNGDADGKQVKMFIVVTPIREDNGPFYYLEKDELTYNTHLAPQPTRFAERWRRGRIANEVVAEIGGRVHSLVGSEAGDRLLVDTLTVYHKGGWCRSSHRLLFELTFEADGYVSEGRQDIGAFAGWSEAEMCANFPSPLHRFMLGLDTEAKAVAVPDAAKWVLFRLNRSVFTYLFASQP